MPPILNQSELASYLRTWAQELGFQGIGAASVDLGHAEPGLLAWLEAGFHGEMGYMKAHGLKRSRPADLLPGTLTVLTLQMPYLPTASPSDWLTQAWDAQQQSGQGIVSLYARGRDYHKVLRKRLQLLASRLHGYLASLEAVKPADLGGDPPFCARVFTDSAPVLEVELAHQSGGGWRGKHTLLLSREAGSMVFLGEIFVNVPLQAFAGLHSSSAALVGHCGSCTRCISACPTQAIVAPYKLDARRCISYLTIEHAGPIPLELRRAIGNRIYGCDDCQLACPWNKFAQRSTLPDFDSRAALMPSSLAWQMGWSEADFLRNTEGSPLRRIGHERWQRNVAVACGNALAESTLDIESKKLIIRALDDVMGHCSKLVEEHCQWAKSQATC